MTRRFADIAFTPAVRELQERYGSRPGVSPQAGDRLGKHEAQYLSRADTFFLATVSETGWPYVQHRGGPKGFLRVLSPTQLGYADFRGNRQYVSAGNAASNDRASILVMDYAERRRLKLLGRLRFTDVADVDAALLRQVELPGYLTRIERVALFDVAAFDWNCPQHITQRFTLDELRQAAGE